MESRSKSPMLLVKEKFETKAKLVEKLMPLLSKEGVSKDTLKNKLLSASNKKLMKLHARFSK